jgi:hypothetical protein
MSIARLSIGIWLVVPKSEKRTFAITAKRSNALFSALRATQQLVLDLPVSAMRLI